MNVLTKISYHIVEMIVVISGREDTFLKFSTFINKFNDINVMYRIAFKLRKVLLNGSDHKYKILNGSDDKYKILSDFSFEQKNPTDIDLNDTHYWSIYNIGLSRDYDLPCVITKSNGYRVWKLMREDHRSYDLPLCIDNEHMMWKVCGNFARIQSLPHSIGKDGLRLWYKFNNVSKRICIFDYI